MTVTRVPLYRVIRQLSLPRAVVSCMTFVSVAVTVTTCTYAMFQWASPPSLNCYLRLIFFVHFLFEWGDAITILPATGATVL